jgi:hypothetical protein
MAENDGLTFAPVLVENLNAIFGFNRTHVPPLLFRCRLVENDKTA